MSLNENIVLRKPIIAQPVIRVCVPILLHPFPLFYYLKKKNGSSLVLFVYMKS
jgi:hypothetical protein